VKLIEMDGFSGKIRNKNLALHCRSLWRSIAALNQNDRLIFFSFSFSFYNIGVFINLDAYSAKGQSATWLTGQTLLD